MKVSIFDSIDFTIQEGCRVRKESIGPNAVCHIENNVELFGIGNVAKEDVISINVVYLKYFFDCFLKRISASSYADKFVIKG